MGVLSAVIVSSGKTLLARQFVEMTRLRVECLVSAFQNLVDSGKDHTFIETETVRYVYQPMEGLHLVLVTKKSSNILEDVETVRLLAKVVQDCCQFPVTEELCVKHALDIVFAFDEVISFGHRESVMLSDIKSYTEMDSYEEKTSRDIQMRKENEAREAAKKKQKELDAKWKEDANQTRIGKSSGMLGFRSHHSSNESPGDMTSSMCQDTTSSSDNSFPQGQDDDTSVFKPKAPRSGMRLSKKTLGDKVGDMIGLAAAEHAETSIKVEASDERVAPVVTPLLESVTVSIEEKVEARCIVEGGLNGEASCTGQFQVIVLDASKADLVCFKLAPPNKEFKYKVHPNLNKASHANNLLRVRDSTRAFQANTPVPLLKWQIKSSDDAFLPLICSCWPTSTADGTQMVLEFELMDDSVSLENVTISFPASPSARPAITSNSTGEAAYDEGSAQVVWQIPVIDKNETSGTFEFSAQTDQASLFPCTLTATRRGRTRCSMEILECYHQDTKETIDFACEKFTVYYLTIG